MPEPRPFAVTEHQWIAMADGVRLSARLWIPDEADKQQVPVVLEYIPYRKRDLYRPIDSLWGAALASHGIAFARVDVRGTGDSEGIIQDEYSEAELDLRARPDSAALYLTYRPLSEIAPPLPCPCRC